MSDDFFEDDGYDDEDFNEDYYVATKDINLANFKKSTSGSVTFVIEAKTEKGVIEYHNYLNEGCFGVLACVNKYLKTYEPLSMTLALRKNVSIDKKDTFAEEYWQWMFDPKKSPWRMLLEGVELHLDDHPRVKFPLSRKTPAQVLLNMLVSSREMHDNPQTGRMFSHLRKQGWKDEEAFFAAIHLGLEQKGTTTVIKDQLGHDWNGFGVRHDNDFIKIRDGKPSYEGANTFGNPYHGVQRIWHKDKSGYGRGEFYSLLVSARKYEGAFPTYFKGVYGNLFMPMNKMPSLSMLLEKREEVFKAIS